MMTEKIELGPTPADEECAQTNQDAYEVLARLECRTFSKQLIRTYVQAHGKDLPEGCRIVTTSNAHDFGTYYEVAIKFDTNDRASIAAAFWLEQHAPTKWDDEARRELSLS